MQVEQDARGGEIGSHAEDVASEVAEYGVGRIACRKAGLKPGLYRLLCADGGVKGDGAEGPDAIVDGLEANGGHE